MRFTGTIVKITPHGRIALPLKIRNMLGIKPKNKVSISINDNSIIIRKHVMECIITGATENVVEVLPGISLSKEGMKILLKELKNFNL